MLTVTELLEKTERTKDYFDTREIYATALAYSLKTSLDATYGSQAIGVYGSAYCVITSTRYGFFAQPEPGVIIPAELSAIELLRSL